MSIKQQIDDAKLLASNGRYLNALTLCLLAVAASSKKCFPQGTKTRNPAVKNPNADMRDREAFCLFLGGRLRKLIWGDPAAPEYCTSGMSVTFKGKSMDLSEALYECYRCSLIHEGNLPPDVEFLESSSKNDSEGRTGGTFFLQSGDKLVFDTNWIDILVAAVVYAFCNAAEFGIVHEELVPKPGVDPDAFRNACVAKYDITPGRYEIMKTAVFQLSPDFINGSDPSTIVSAFHRLVTEGILSGGEVAGLSTGDLTDGRGLLQRKGMAALYEIAQAFDLRVRS